MIQIDGVRRQAFIKLTSNDKVMTILRETNGQVEYKYPTGEIYQVNIDLAGMGTKRIRIANLPPEIPDNTLRDALEPYGKVLEVQTESWSKAYRYAVPNGIRQIKLVMAKHAPSHLTVAGYRVLISYDGQPVTCYGCGKTEHIFQDCPTRQAMNRARTTSRPASYANVLANTTRNAETNRQDNSETEIQSKTKTQNNYSREVQHATTSQRGLAKEEKDEPKQESRIIKYTTVQQIETPPNTERKNHLAPAEHSSMKQKKQRIHNPLHRTTMITNKTYQQKDK